jgi:hypothetical protein
MLLVESREVRGYRHCLAHSGIAAAVVACAAFAGLLVTPSVAVVKRGRRTLAAVTFAFGAHKQVAVPAKYRRCSVGLIHAMQLWRDSACFAQKLLWLAKAVCAAHTILVLVLSVLHLGFCSALKLGLKHKMSLSCLALPSNACCGCWHVPFGHLYTVFLAVALRQLCFKNGPTGSLFRQVVWQACLFCLLLVVCPPSR